MKVKNIIGLACFILFLFAVQTGFSSNVRVIDGKGIKIDPSAMTDNIAEVKFSIEWDNSWRDDFNWDAVYIFLKYKKKTELEWKHVYLMDDFHILSDGYAYWMGKTETTLNRSAGIFVHRNKIGSGKAVVDLTLKWKVTENGLTTYDFSSGSIEYAAECVEMVYVPQGPFCLGDGISDTTFRTEYRPILPEWDLIKNNGVQKFYASGVSSSAEYKANPPSLAANRINAGRNTAFDNAWIATSDEIGKSYWYVDFGAGNEKVIKYFGVTGVYNQTASRPRSWCFQGTNDLNTGWNDLQTGTDVDWTVNTDDTYPVPKAIRVPDGKRKAYRYYRIQVTASSARVAASNIAMTDKEVDSLTNYAFVVDRQGIALNKTTGLSSGEPDNWSGNLQVNYPTGFHGFYVMKYEISQEQYVRFLNKLQYNQQKLRTVGNTLDVLAVGNFVYGNKRTAPSFRNGIVVGSKDGGTVVFANNLNNNNIYAEDGDGQNIACNYLSPADMLAYADWAGLRPMSEMEFEKCARKPYPATPVLREYAWNSSLNLHMPQGTTITASGTLKEKLANANVNAGSLGDDMGPVRVGSFASGAANQALSGGSFWGVMELSGNLAEICYNIKDGAGRTFSYIREAHGNGGLYGESTGTPGNTDMSTGYWPQTPNAFALRGGSFRSLSKQLAISDRSKFIYFSDINKKDSTATFRLVHSHSNLLTETGLTYLRLKNGRLSNMTAPDATDTVCTGTSYTITGSMMLYPKTNALDPDVKMNLPGTYNFVWYISENSGVSWQIIRGEQSKDLTYDNFYNESQNIKEIWFKRSMITPSLYSETGIVKLKIINTAINYNRLKDTINSYNQVLGFWINTPTPTNFTWRWLNTDSGAGILKASQRGARWDYFAPERWDFSDNNNLVLDNRTHTLRCEMNMANKCIKKIDFQVFLAARPLENRIAKPSEITMDVSNPIYGCGAPMKDSRGDAGQVYGTVKIGNQCWMAENLRFKGDGVPIMTQSGDPDGKKYGYLYNYTAAVIEKACPPGWKLPSNADVNTLNAYVNSDGANKAGQRLRAGNYWNYTNESLVGTNTTGFGAMASGHNGNSGFGSYFYVITSEGYYYYLDVNSNSGFSGAHGWASWYWMTIRCIKK